MSSVPTTDSSRQVRVLLSVVLLAEISKMTLNPIIAPLAREAQLAEWQVGATISLAATMFVVTSQFWGRRSQSWGRKNVLALSLSGATISMIGFALVAAAGVRGILAGTGLFLWFLLLRGIGFGGTLAAVNPTAQAYIADVTPDRRSRVKGMAGVGAMQSIGMIGGAVVGGVLTGFGLLAPVLVVPLLLGFALVATLWLLPRENRRELIPNPAKISPTDPRVWPFLLAGFGMFTAVGFMQIVTGFIVQDRFNLNSQVTGTVTGATLLAWGIGLIISQAVIVPRSGWAPATLLRVGTCLATVGMVLMVPNLGMATLIFAMFVAGLGMGIATPGYTAGPTLLMERDEMGGVTGLIGAVNGLTFVVAPVASTILYGMWGPLPLVVSAAIMGTVALFTLVNSQLRTLGATENEAGPKPSFP